MNKYFKHWVFDREIMMFSLFIVTQFLTAAILIGVGWMWALFIPVIGWIFAVLCLNSRADELENGYALRHEEGDRRTRTD